jgi:hypothetical protein
MHDVVTVGFFYIYNQNNSSAPLIFPWQLIWMLGLHTQQLITTNVTYFVIQSSYKNV